MDNPNSFDEEIQDANANPEIPVEGTEQTETVTIPDTQAVDYKTKFQASSAEAQRLYTELKELKETKVVVTESENFNPTPETVDFEGFNDLDEDAQANLVAYTNAVKKSALDEVYKDPAIAFARTSYNENKWQTSFAEASRDIPDLAGHEEEFKTKYYNPSNVPENMTDIIKDLAKIYLFDKAKDIGAKEEAEKVNRIDLEDVTGGDKVSPTSSRSIEDWQRMASANPAKFASLSKEFNEDMAKN
ncbi:hypothetical protein KAU11_08300 [Candidatus Babeliales bacterium]|nr:hypothetical protein [Candidatus Babeliales bacterium]